MRKRMASHMFPIGLYQFFKEEIEKLIHLSLLPPVALATS